MKIFNSLNTFHTQKQTVVTIGTFDGVHVGHQKIIEKLIHNAVVSDCESVILTFFPHPRMVLQEGTVMKQLNTLDEKISLNVIFTKFKKSKRFKRDTEAPLKTRRF